MLRRCAVLLIVGLVPVLSGCPAPGGGDWQAQMLRSINTIRAGAGVGPVSLCGTLGAAAQQHSEDQAGRSTMSHSGADGSRIGDRAGRSGYGGWSALAENIASGQTTVDLAMWSWMSSPGHRENILDPAYSHVGFGRASSSGGTQFWTQDFGAGGSC